MTFKTEVKTFKTNIGKTKTWANGLNSIGTTSQIAGIGANALGQPEIGVPLVAGGIAINKVSKLLKNYKI